MAEALSAPSFGCLNYTFAVKPESLSSELAEMSAKFAASFPAGCVEASQTSGTASQYLFAMYEGKLTARCSIWTETKLLHPPTAAQLELAGNIDVRLGFIGHYAATSLRAGVELLELALAELKRKGCNYVIGPIDGSTWKRYRLITESCGEPLFALEPVNPMSWNNHFQLCGFGSIKTYGSSLNKDLKSKDPELKTIKSRMSKQGVRLRSLDTENLQHDLEGIHRVTMDAMRDNFLFSPVDKATFLKEQMKLTALADPELVVVAEKAGKIVGYLFSYPDRPCLEVPQRLIMKTIARDPDEKLKGLGRLLFQETHARAYEKGFREAIHALYATGNTASEICHFYGEQIRSYALYGKAV
jgi:L-amino acid N-acyltransferase YncA